MALYNKNDKGSSYLCAVSDISEGKPKVFSVRNDKGNRIELVLFNIERKFYAIANRCVMREDHSMMEYWKVM